MPPQLSPPIGSVDFDLNEAHVYLGHALHPSIDQSKFIVVEDRIDAEGTVFSAEEEFDPQRMCYSLFTAPRIHAPYHRDIPQYLISSGRKDLQKRVGRIVGGGFLQFGSSDGSIELRDISTTFKREPMIIRNKLTLLLSQHIPSSHAIPEPDDERSYNAEVARELNPYWLRYASVLQSAEKLLTPGELNFKKELYV